MTDAGERGFRQSAFLLAAVALPLLVVGLFLVASAVPRWTVAAPQYDLLLRADSGSAQPGRQVLVIFRVHEGRVEAQIQPAALNSDARWPSLFLVDHQTLAARQVTLDLPLRLDAGEALRTVAIGALRDRRASDGMNAPDGYAFAHRGRRGAGIIGDLFGMSRHDAGVAIVKNGRVVPISIPEPQRYSLEPIGWLEPEAR